MKLSVNTLKSRGYDNMYDEAKEAIMQQCNDLRAQIAFKSALHKILGNDYDFLVIEEDWVSLESRRSFSGERSFDNMEELLTQVIEKLPPVNLERTLKYAGGGTKEIGVQAVEVCINNYEHTSDICFKYMSEQGFRVWVKIPPHWIGFALRRYSVQKDRYSRAQNPEMLWGYEWSGDSVAIQRWGTASSLTNGSAFLSKEQFYSLFKKQN